jgi:hypothetical protein
MGKRVFGLVPMVMALGLGSAAGQSAADGSVQGNVYTNRYFHISLALPPNFHAVNLSALHAPGALASNEFLMLAARDGEGPSGIVVLAEKLKVAPSHVVDEQDFLRRTRKGWDAGQVADGQEVQIQKGGLTFQELDFEIPKTEFDSVIVTRVGDYLIAFKCNAKTRDKLKVMVDAVVAMRHE